MSICYPYPIEMYFTNRKILYLPLLTVITICIILYCFFLSRDKELHDLFKDYTPKQKQDIVMEGLDFRQISKDVPMFTLKAHTVATQPLRWNFFELIDYYELILSDVEISTYSLSESGEKGENQGLKGGFKSIIETILPSMDTGIIITVADNLPFHRSKTPARILLSPVNIKIFYQDQTWLSMDAATATLELNSQILILGGDVRLKNSSGTALNMREALWKYDDEIIETVGTYTFLNGRLSREGANRQFSLDNGWIKKGEKGPLLALFRPQNPVLSAMDTFAAKTDMSKVLPFNMMFFNQSNITKKKPNVSHR